MVNSKKLVFLSKVIKAVASLSALLACSSATLTKTKDLDLNHPQNVNRFEFDSSGIKSALKHVDKSTIADAIESNCDKLVLDISNKNSLL